MAPTPKIMPHSEWMDRTKHTAWHGRSDAKRSESLVKIDNMVDMYNRDPKPNWLEGLRQNLENWLQGKTKGDRLNTIRDHSGAVRELKRQIDNAVLLHEPLPWNGEYPGIYIARDIYRGNDWVPDDFVTVTTRDLDTIASKPVGKGLLKSIAAKCLMDSRKKVIIEYVRQGSMAAPTNDTSNAFRKKVQQPQIQGGEEGFAKRMLENPNIVALPQKPPQPIGQKLRTFIGNEGASCFVLFAYKENLDERPSFIALAHELVHAYHYLHGACYRGIADEIRSRGDSGIMEEEMRTVGFGKYKGEIPSENAIRAEHNQAERASYGESDFSNVQSSI